MYVNLHSNARLLARSFLSTSSQRWLIANTSCWTFVGAPFTHRHSFEKRRVERERGREREREKEAEKAYGFIGPLAGKRRDTCARERETGSIRSSDELSTRIVTMVITIQASYLPSSYSLLVSYVSVVPLLSLFLCASDVIRERIFIENFA